MLLHPGNDCGSDRHLILPLIIWAVSIGLILGMVLWASKVFAADVHVFNDGGTVIRLTDSPCKDGRTVMLMAQMVPPQYFDRFKAIESVFALRDGTSKPYAGCWMELSTKETGTDEPALIMLFEDGDNYQVPRCKFLKTCDQKKSVLRI